MQPSPKYSVGDKVIVKKRCDMDYTSYGRFNPDFNSDMEQWVGKEVTIKEVFNSLNGLCLHQYSIEETEWSWSDYMFEDKMIKFELPEELFEI